ncbi:MAG: CoA transferase [Alcaligenaceae bacterium]|nr:MAG: CoA transferase [Alcaligenaceae bacterium]
MSGPLAGIHVVDLTSVGMGPYATQTLGDMGAEVIKVETAAGDIFRYTTPSVHVGMSAAFVQLNRNKRSIVLDLKTADDLDVLKKLIDRADVLVYSIRPQAMRRLGLDYETLKQTNARLIYCGAYGFSEKGPYAGRPAFDDIIQAMSGLADVQGRGAAQAPAYVNAIVADKVSGLTTVNAIAMALYEREQSKQGQAIEVPMFETMVAFNLVEHMAGASFTESTAPMGYARILSKLRKPYRTADGYIGLLPYTTEQWRRFFELSGCAAYAREPRFMEPSQRAVNIEEMYEILEKIVAQHPTEYWVTTLQAADVPVTAVQSLEDLLKDPHLEEIGFFQTAMHPTEGAIKMPGIAVQFSRTPGSIRRLAPQLGEHSVEIRGELNLDRRAS